MLRRINLSAAIIVLVCFFLPWEQVSCGGASDTLSGLELARHNRLLLWLIPLLMLAVVVVGLLRKPSEALQTAIVSLIAGAVAAYLMNDERARVNNVAGVISAQLTGWFWLAFLASLTMIATAIGMLFRRQRAP